MDKGIKCKINIPDTVLFRYGQLSAWWSSNKDGCIKRHTSQSTSLEAIRKRFLSVAQQDDANYSKFVGISWLGSGKPQLLRVMAFNQLCELLSDRLESGRPDQAPEIETPAVLQAFIQPWQDLRYITTYINAGTSITCHTFQRKYSRRYTPMSAATAAQVDARDADIIMSVGADGDQRRAEIDANQGVVEPSLKMHLRKLTAHLVKYIQRAHGLTLGGIVCEYIRDADGKVYLMSVLRTEWSSNAGGHGAGSLNASVLQAPVVDLLEVGDGARPPSPQPKQQYDAMQTEGDQEEFVDEDEGEDEFGPLPPSTGHSPRTSSHRPASAMPSTPDRQPSPTQHRPRALSAAYDSTAAGGVGVGDAGRELGMELSGGLGLGTGSGVLTRPMTARPSGRSSPGEALQPTTSATAIGRATLAQYPGSQGRLGGLGVSVSNTWPSEQHEASLAPQAPANTIPQLLTDAHGTHRVQSAGLPPPAVYGGGSRTSTAQQRPSSSPSATLGGFTKNQRGRAVSPGGAPGGAPFGFSSTTHRTSHVCPDRPYSARGVGNSPPEFAPVPGGMQPPLVGTLTARGDHVNGGARGAPLMLSHLQKEVEMLRDQLMYQHELAEASAAKVRILEREAHVVTTTFDNRKHELQHLLAVNRDELATVKADRDTWQKRAVDAEARASEMEQERNSLSNTVNSDRATTLNALREYQTRDASQKERLEQLEAEVLRMSTSLKMETTAVNSLKRQLLEFSEIAERNKNTLRDADLDPALVEVMSRTGYLLNGQGNPTGEQYAIQKILQHYASDLRSVFLFYCQLEQSFADHWPPSMGFPNWMLFCRDSETSDPRAGARVRSNQHFPMLQPSQCEELFTKFSRQDDSATRMGKSENVLTYESFLCCVMAAAAALRRHDVPFLSEALREYVLRYLSRAKRVTPQGMGRGMLRSAVEGTRASPSMLSDAGRQTNAGALESSSNGALGPQASAHLHQSERDCPCATGTKKKRVQSAATSAGGAGSRHSSRPASAASFNPARMLHEAGNSAVMKELALLSLTSPSSTREVIRTGGGFSLA